MISLVGIEYVSSLALIGEAEMFEKAKMGVLFEDAEHLLRMISNCVPLLLLDERQWLHE